MTHQHKSPEARARCYSCSRPALLEVTPADRERAAQLIADGFKSTSNKYRDVARLVGVPAFSDAITFDPRVPAWLRKHMQDSWDSWILHGLRCNQENVERVTLALGEFRAFKELGGQSA